MKNQVLHTFFLVGLVIALFSGCTGINQSMREPNSHMQWHKADFSYSGQVSASASTTKILMIDWARLFKKTGGTVEGGGTMLPSLASLPVIGNVLSDRTASYALYELMQANPGYDVIFYPQYETTVKRPIIGLGFIMTKTDVKVTARLAKIN
jgi:hypothetical protein